VSNDLRVSKLKQDRWVFCPVVLRGKPMNKQAAEKEAAEKNLTDPKEFCPLINQICRKDCVCWIKFRAHPLCTSSESYAVRGGYCGNGMFQDRPELI